MTTPLDIKATILSLRSQDERARDNAAESLGDLIEYALSKSPTELQAIVDAELQAIVDALGRALENESSQLVVESILDAIAKAKDRQPSLVLPSALIRRRLPSLEGSAIDHAEYILQKL